MDTYIDCCREARRLGGVALMCCTVRLSRCDRYWFSISATTVSSSWFPAGLSGSNQRKRAVTYA